MRFKQVGNKYDVAAIVFKNNDAQNIKVNAPVVLDFSPTTELGAQAKSTNSLAAAEQGNFFGISLTEVLPGQYGEAQVFGFNPNARIVLTTRAASTDVWASQAAGSIGEYLTMGTGTGLAASVGDQALVRVGTAAQTVNQMVRLAETFASATTLASSLGPQTATIWTITKKVFLRAM